MAMRPCIHCGADISYDRDLKDIVTGNKVGYWRDFTNNNVCAESPTNLHDPGDVMTPPSDPDGIEAYLSGNYVPKVPCESVFGMDEAGNFLSCGLAKDHDGACQAGTPVPESAPVDPTAPTSAPEAGPQPLMIGVAKEYDEENGVYQIQVGFPDESAAMVLMMKEDVDPNAVFALLNTIAQAADTTFVEAARKRRAASTPELLEDVDDIEKFLDGE